MPTYYNSNTNTRHTFAAAQPRLESLPQWRVVEEDSEAADDARARAEAEKRSIEEASKTRSQESTKFHEEALEIAAASAQTTGGPANVTLASHTPPGYLSTEGVLARAKGDQASGALQIGPDPDRHPRTTEELEAKAAEDSARIAALKPEQSSVLERAGVDDGIPDPDQPDEETDSENTEDVDGDEPVAPPSKSARVGEWRTYAIEERDGDPDEVGGMTRDELIARYGQ